MKRYFNTRALDAYNRNTQHPSFIIRAVLGQIWVFQPGLMDYSKNKPRIQEFKRDP